MSLKFDLKSSNHIGGNLKIEIIFYGKYFIFLSAIFLLIWLFGYFQINILWGIIGILTFIIYRRTVNRQRQNFNFGIDLSNDVKYVIDNFSTMPSWVSFPDFESVEWINKIIKRLWPSITIFLNRIIRKTILKHIQKKLKGVNLKDIHFGDDPPKIGGIKIYDIDNISREEIIIDLNIYYFSPAEITLQYNQLQFGIRNFELKADVRIQINSLIPIIPFFGSISLTLLHNPHVNFEFTDLVSILNMPGLKSLLKETVNDMIADTIVLPNRIHVHLHNDIDKKKFMYHMPDGVIRIHAIEAASLKAMDVKLLESNASDPYMIIRVGAVKFKTKVINNCLNPKWNEVFEAIVDYKAAQTVELELFDKDKNNKDDFLGRVSFDIEGAYDRGIFDTWLQLVDVDTGSVHLNLTWLDLSSDPASFDLEEERMKSTNSKVNVGILYVSLDSGKNFHKPSANEDPDPSAKISLGNQLMTSSIKKKTINPVWEENFKFWIQSLLSTVLNIQVKDEKSKKSLGNCSFKVEKLLNEPNMESFLTLKLDNSNDSNSTIQIYVALRALLAKKTRTSTFSRTSSVRTSESYSQSLTSKIDIKNNESNVIPEIVEPIDEVFEIPKDENSLLRSNSQFDKSSPDLLNEPPKVNLTYRYTANRNMFIVVVHKVMNLKHDHAVYVTLSMHPKDNRNGKRKTKSIKNQNLLVYDETFEFFLNKELLKASELLLNFKIERHSVIKRNYSIGCCKIDLNDFNPASIKSNWFPIDISKSNRNSDTMSMASNHSGVFLKE